MNQHYSAPWLSTQVSTACRPTVTVAPQTTAVVLSSAAHTTVRHPINPHPIPTPNSHTYSTATGTLGLASADPIRQWSMEPQCDRLSFRVSVPHDVEVNEDDDEPATDEEEETDE